MSTFSIVLLISVHVSGPSQTSHALFAFDHHDGSPAHLRLVQEPPTAPGSWIMTVDTNSISRERILILNAEPVRIYDEGRLFEELF